MDRWQPVSAEERFGIVIQNFDDAASFRLRLSLGEKVIIKEKNGEWYLGHTSSKFNQMGIFPKSFIFLKICETKVSQAVKQKPDFIEEVTSTIREWVKIWKKIYMERKTNFLRIKMMIEDLIFFRSKMLSGLLTKHQLLEIKRAVISLMEDGNKLLGLDMEVRDENGDIPDPRCTPILKMYELHAQRTEKIRQSINGPSRNGAMEMSSYFHAFYVSIEECDLFIEDDLQFILFLYDSLEELPLTENFVFLWKRDAQVSGTEKSILSVLFKDLAPEDMRKEQVYLVCYVIKISKRENKDCEYSDSIDINDDKKKNGYYNKGKKCKRRPFGVAAVDVSPYLSETGEHDKISLFLPFLQFDCGDLASSLRKLILLICSEKKQHVNNGLRVIAKVLPGEVNETCRRDQQLKLKTAVPARKMGIPKVVFPSYVRNEIYLTLVEGEFHKTTFTPDKNIEVAVYLCDEKGAKVSDMIFIGAGVKPLREYRSVIYYHNMKPKWMETIKISLPHNVSRGLHLKFTFTHRAISNLAEKPFALSYIKILQNNGALLFDGKYSLVVYKVDQNKWKDEDHMYLYLPSKPSEVRRNSIKGFSVNKKDKLIIQTLTCSTKLTQNVHLVWLLDWMNNRDILHESLTALLNMNGREVAKFLPEILDVLFKIMMEDACYQAHENLIFSCLVYVFDIVSDEKYSLIQNVLESYIRESFCFPTVFGKLILLLEKHFKNIYFSKKECLLKLVRSLKFFMKCIVKSKQLHDKLCSINMEVEFETPLKELLNTISKSLCCCEELDLSIKREMFIHLYPVYSEILEDFQDLFHCAAQEFCVRIAELFKEHNVNSERSSVLIASDVIQSKVFFIADCRAILIPVIFDYIIKDLQNLVEIELCVDCLMNLLDMSFELGIDSSIKCIIIIKTVINSILHVGNLKIVGKMLTLVIALLAQKQFDFTQQCMHHFSENELLLLFLMEMLIFFEKLVSRPVYPSDWNDMLLLQNSVILKAIKSISTIIGRKFLNPFELQIWSNYFHSSVAFVTQPCLQLETFSEKKRMRILMNFKDMRKEMTHEIKNMWFTLGPWKGEFIPDLVGPFLEISAIPDVDILMTIVPLFFDMAQCEFYSYEYLKTDLHGSNIQNTHNFQKFEKEFINSMNKLLEEGKGELTHMNQFYDTLSKCFDEGASIKDEGSRFVTSIKYQLKWLHLYKKHIQDDNKGNAITCAYELLINNTELYTRYVYKLFNLHLECENYTEAAYSLDLLSNLLDWSDEPVPLYLVANIYHDYRSNYTFKEALFEDIITYLDKGRMWSAALSYCKELSKIYEHQIQDYQKLSNILKKMAQFYDNIMNETFPEAEYFCIYYYGRGFPCFLQYKTFIYRWRMTEKLGDFNTHIQRLFPTANLVNVAPGSEIKESSSQNIYIRQVYPVFNDKKYMNLPIHGQILRHLLESDLKIFYCSTPLITQDSSEYENSSLRLCNSRTIYCTSVSFPGILVQAPVVSTESHEISPIKIFIDEVKRNSMSLYSVLPLGNNAYSNKNYIFYKLKKTVEGSIIYNASAELKSFLMGLNKQEDLRKLMMLLKEQKSLLQFFLNFLGEDFPESLKIYMPNMEGIINEFLLDSDCKTSNDIGFHFPEFIKEKSVKDAENNELSRKSGYKIIDGFKRKASLTRKIILQSRRSSEIQAGNSQWYIPSPSGSNMPSVSTLSSMNFSDEMGRDSVFYAQASLAGSQKSLSYKSLQNLRDASMDIHENLIIKSKADETVSLPGHLHSYEKLRFAVYNSTTSVETDCLSFVSAVSHMNVPFPSNPTDESQHLSIASAPGNEMVNATPPPLPPKLLENERLTSGNVINEEDKSSYESTKLSNEALSILSRESGKLCLDKQENEMENDIPPPVPPRKKRLNKK